MTATSRVIATGAVVVLLVGAAWAVARFASSQGSDGPPPLESVAGDAEVYRQALAGGDLESYRDVVEPMLGVTIDQAFVVERGCLDWSAATITVAPHGISPFFAVVTFAAEDLEVIRKFQYLSGRWIATVEATC